MSITNKCEDKGGIGDVDNFESLDIDFHNANKKRTEIADTDITSLKQKGGNNTGKEDTGLCRMFSNLSKNAIEGTK